MKYLVSVDFSDITNLVIRSAKVLALKLNKELELLHVMAPLTYLPYPEGLSIDIVDLDIIQKAEDNAKKIAEEKLLALKEYLEPIKTETKVIVDTPFSEVITKEAEDNNLEAIILGGHSKNLVEKILVGSTTEEVVRNSKVSNIVIKSKEIEKIEHIMIGYDFTQTCDNMLDFIFNTFKSLKPKITLIHIDKGMGIELAPGISQTIEQDINNKKLEKLNKIKERFSKEFNFDYKIINSSDISNALEKEAEMINPDIIFIASKKTKFVERIFGRYETIKILRATKYPLYIFKSEVDNA